MNVQKIKLTPWSGGECPVPSRTTTIILSSDGHFNLTTRPGTWIWGHANLWHIIAYAALDIEVVEPKKKRLMRKHEVRKWASGADSWGWEVRRKNEATWADPEAFNYVSPVGHYRRRRILPDGTRGPEEMMEVEE